MPLTNPACPNVTPPIHRGCEQKFALVRTTTQALRAYSSAVRELQRNAHRASYEELIRSVDQARELLAQANDALTLHRQEHGC